MILVLFGASGDICKRKVIPGLFEWYKEDNNFQTLKKNEGVFTHVFGYGRTPLSDQAFRDKIRNDLGVNDQQFLDIFKYQVGFYDKLEDFKELFNRINNSVRVLEKKTKILFYFGVPSHLVPNAIKNICLSGLDSNFDCRYIVEKPIGNSLENCIEILDNINISEEKVFILDHYLGKTNISENIILNNPENIEIYLNERNRVDHRLEYFDKVGIFRDMVQSHAMSILLYCFPNVFKIDNIQDIKLLDHKLDQYSGYRGSKTTETYIKLVLLWNNTKIVIETGKGLDIDKKLIEYDDNFIEIISSKSEYKLLFQNAFNGDKSKYLTRKNIIDFWQISDYIWNKIKNIENNTKRISGGKNYL